MNNLLNLESIVSKLRTKNICDNINDPKYRTGYNNALKDIQYEIDQIPLENKNDIELENNVKLIKKHYSTLSHIKLSLIDIEHCARYFYKLGLKSQIKLK